MKKSLILTLMAFLAIGAQAQLNMSSRTGSTLIDSRDNYLVAFEDGEYQLVTTDYFSKKEVVLALGETKSLALASVLQIEEWMKQAKKGDVNPISQYGSTCNLVKVDGSTMLLSEGDKDYCIGAYYVLVPDMKKYSTFISQVVTMPHAIGHLSKSDLSRIKNKLIKQ